MHSIVHRVRIHDELPKVIIDPTQLVVSGLSSGAYMANQMHVAFSTTFTKGAGIIAGGPYYCARNSEMIALEPCMKHSELIPVDKLVEITRTWAKEGAIDDPRNMSQSRAYLFSGKLDTVVHQGVMEDLEEYYSNFLLSENIHFRKDILSEHSVVTDLYGNPCPILNPPYINNCAFDSIGEMLKFIFGPLKEKNLDTLNGKLLPFDQHKYGEARGLADIGYIFIPPKCEPKAKKAVPCKLIVALHGCLQNADIVGIQFVSFAGYNNWADSNDMVVLYPQTGLGAINGCWDWWGYSSPDYAKKSGPQMSVIKRMVDYLLNP